MVVVPSLWLLAWLSANHCGCRNATLVGGSVVALLSSVVGAEEGGCGCHCSGCSGWLLFVVVSLSDRRCGWLLLSLLSSLWLLSKWEAVLLLFFHCSVVGAEEGIFGCHCSVGAAVAGCL